MKTKVFDNGLVTFEKLFPSGMYLVELSLDNGTRDKMRCDSYKSACEYFKAFCAIAKNSKG
jgi:hypothetical protein